MRYGGRVAGPTIRSRADRQVYMFLFRKLMLMTKKEDDGYQYKMHLEVVIVISYLSNWWCLRTYMYVCTSVCVSCLLSEYNTLWAAEVFLGM